MTRVQWTTLFERAFQLPPHIAAWRTARFAVRRGQSWLALCRDRATSAYVADELPCLALPPVRFGRAVGGAEVANLREACAHYLRHEFDLLGSGWQSAAYGAAVRGIEDVRLPSAAGAVDPPALVSWPNRARARAIWSSIDDAGYRAIDWQRDLRSGYRWASATHFRDIRVAPARGVDVKLAWELSRLQHLPQLALAAACALDGLPGFRPAAVYAGEVRNQCLDFLASNPPRYGAAWACPMDVGIRAANIVLALALLTARHGPFDAAFESAIAAGLIAHGRHLVDNLEWSEQGRSNHFLADLAGLVLICAALPLDAERKRWLAYAARWLVHDCTRQFLDDGGNYEGSTGYHRLSAEVVIYSLAALAGMRARKPDLLAALDAVDLRGLRGGAPPTTLVAGYAACGPRIAGMLEVLRVTRRPDGALMLIGDMDSGRLFKLAQGAAVGPATAGDADPGETLAAGQTLLGEQAEAPASCAAQIVAALIGGAPLVGPARPSRATASLETHRLSALADSLRDLPPAARRDWHIPVAGLTSRAFELHALPDFGVYVLRDQRCFLALRCTAGPVAGAPTGHFHDDNLALELYIDGVPLISDAGTYVYTSFPELRNRYRAAAAHFAPRAAHWSAAAFTDYLFELRVRARAECLHFSPAGIAARLVAEEGEVMRIVRLGETGIEVTDACRPGVLAPLAPAIPYCSGYGRPTARLVHPF